MVCVKGKLDQLVCMKQTHENALFSFIFLP